MKRRRYVRMTVREAANVANVDADTVYRWIHEGRLRLSRGSTRRYVPRCISWRALVEAMRSPVDVWPTLC